MIDGKEAFEGRFNILTLRGRLVAALPHRRVNPLPRVARILLAPTRDILFALQMTVRMMFSILAIDVLICLS